MGHLDGITESLCANTRRSAIFSEQLGDLITCKGRCEASPDCNFVNAGWEHAPTWCMMLTECSEPLDTSGEHNLPLPLFRYRSLMFQIIVAE